MTISPEDIDALLPQTQCGLCGYGGCMPYAEAIVYENAAINLCPPGGVKTLRLLGEKLQQSVEQHVAEMANKEKPFAQAVIREDECIGCMKCIQACPVDAIIGSGKLMHTVIADECTGCELCIPPCPVDCIDMLPAEVAIDKSTQYRKRFQAREQRLQAAKQEKRSRQTQQSIPNRKAYIEAALQRMKAKR